MNAPLMYVLVLSVPTNGPSATPTAPPQWLLGQQSNFCTQPLGCERTRNEPHTRR